MFVTRRLWRNNDYRPPMSTKCIVKPTHDRHKSHNQAAITHRITYMGVAGGESEYEDDKKIDASSSVNDVSKRLFLRL